MLDVAAHALPPAGELMPLGRDADAMARVLKLLANPDRLRMLCRMGMSELDGGLRPTVGEMVALTGLSQSRVSQHLALLREEGMVETRREAQSIYYSLVPGPAFQVIQTLHGIYCGPPRAPLQRNGGTP